MEMKQVSNMRFPKIINPSIGKLCGSIVLVLFSTSLFAADNSQGLQLPDDLAEKAEIAQSESAGPTPKYTIEERRYGDRLDQITVRRKNGIDGIYDNSKANSLWQAADEEIGQTHNQRKWTIGSW